MKRFIWLFVIPIFVMIGIGCRPMSSSSERETFDIYLIDEKMEPQTGVEISQLNPDGIGYLPEAYNMQTQEGGWGYLKKMNKFCFYAHDSYHKKMKILNCNYVDLLRHDFIVVFIDTVFNSFIDYEKYIEKNKTMNKQD